MHSMPVATSAITINIRTLKVASARCTLSPLLPCLFFSRREGAGCICPMHCNLHTIHTRKANHGLACVASVRCTQCPLLRWIFILAHRLNLLHLSDALKISCYNLGRNKNDWDERVASVRCTVNLLLLPSGGIVADSKIVASVRCTQNQLLQSWPRQKWLKRAGCICAMHFSSVVPSDPRSYVVR